MPQYDAYEDPPLLPQGPGNPPVIETQHVPNQTTEIHDLSQRREDIITGSHDASSHNDPFHSQMAFYGRHAHLSRQNRPGEKLVDSVASPESPANISSPKILSETETRELAAMEKSQQEDDEIRMDLQSRDRAESEGGDKQHADAETGSEEKEGTNRGGWMRRSRACSELLAENDVIRTDHNNYRL